MALDGGLLRALSGYDGGDPSVYPGAFPPPPGVVPNLENPPDSGRAVAIASLATCLAIATILFALRAYVKIRITRNLLLEDATCLVAWLALMVFTAVSATMVHYGLGYHSWDISVYNYAQLLKWLYAVSIVYEPAAFFTKITLLLLLARVYAVKTNAARGIYAFIFLLFLGYAPIFGVKVGVCSPPSAFWDPNVPGSCRNLRKLYIADTAFAIVTDAFISLAPIPLALGMQISWKKKAKIIILLGAGGVATATTIYRLVKLISYLDSKDVAADFALLDILTMLELTIGLICSCLPALNILIERCRSGSRSGNSPRTKGSRQRNAGEAKSRLAWNWLGTDASQVLRWTTHAETAVRRSPDSPERHQDMEQARRPSRDRVDTHTVGGRSETAANPRLVIDRVNTNDGRLEGWLNSKPHAEAVPETSAGNGHAHERQLEESDATAKISNELAKVSGNGQWCHIWDGRANGNGSSSHQC